MEREPNTSVFDGTVAGFDGKPRPRGYMLIDVTMMCGTCDGYLQTDYGNKKDAAWQARNAGWTLTRAYGWCCPECSAKLPHMEDR